MSGFNHQNSARREAEFIRAVEARGGNIRMSEAIKTGVSRYMFYSLVKRGILERVSRGTYRMSLLPPISDPDLVTIALRTPNAVICLISALSFHDITTQIPHEVAIAFRRGDRIPKIDHPPISVHRFSNAAYEAGIEIHNIDEVNVQIYSPEKTIVDCFKFRNKIGMDVVLESLKLYRERSTSFNTEEILQYARICRVEKVIRPYLESIL